MKPLVLVVEDESVISEPLREHLQREASDAEVTESVAAASAAFEHRDRIVGLNSPPTTTSSSPSAQGSIVGRVHRREALGLAIVNADDGGTKVDVRFRRAPSPTTPRATPAPKEAEGA